ncbi:MAG: hypothetical protein AAFO69_16330 [Bacteroidota bacterium]
MARFLSFQYEEYTVDVHLFRGQWFIMQITTGFKEYNDDDQATISDLLHPIYNKDYHDCFLLDKVEFLNRIYA